MSDTIALIQRHLLPGGACFDIRDGRIGRVGSHDNRNDWIARVPGG
ncbi:hypothetical protein ACO2Q2_09000 [Dyella sp. KRB-257]